MATIPLNRIEMNEADLVSRCVSGEAFARTKLYEVFFTRDAPVYFGYTGGLPGFHQAIKKIF